MVEGGAEEVPEADMVEALLFGHKAVQPVIELQEEMRRELGVTEARLSTRQPRPTSRSKAWCGSWPWSGISQGYGIAEKHARYDALSEVKKADPGQAEGAPR